MPAKWKPELPDPSQYQVLVAQALAKMQACEDPQDSFDLFVETTILLGTISACRNVQLKHVIEGLSSAYALAMYLIEGSKKADEHPS